MRAPANNIYHDVTGVILAGGKSTRMGQDKALLELDGTPIFERVLTAFRQCFARTLIAGNRPDLARPELPYFADRYPGSALGGLLTGLACAETPFIFVTACDLPFIRPGTIRAVIEQRNGWDAIVPNPPTGPEPLFALYAKSCLPAIEAHLKRGNYRILDIYADLSVRFLAENELPIDWHASLSNINTPEDLQRARQDEKR